MTEKNVELMRHSLSHVMAAAVLEMFPEAKLGIGPAIENGFYYDFDLPRTLIPEDLPLIEEKMQKIIKGGFKFEKTEVPIDKALGEALKNGQEYKADLIRELADKGEKKVSFYRLNNFTDLCAGPHLSSTKEIGAFKLVSIAGAYWRGDEKNKMLQRIYGVGFPSKDELDEYLKSLEEAKKRDHRKLGEELELFLINDTVGAGLPIWLPKGAVLKMTIRDYLTKRLMDSGYEMVESPHIAQSVLWKTSGHAEFYKDNMYSSFKADQQEFLVKPMNCPFHIYAYKHKLRSYRDLPIRLAEFGTVYRYEKSGVLHGLMRVRGFTQDDAHIFCTEEQVESEIKKAVSFALSILKDFGFSKFDIYLSTKPEKAVGHDQDWDRATRALKKALESEKIKYEIDPGEGVFYGPKIDIKIKDSLGRSWQCTTVQVDFNLPERFDLEYIDGKQAKMRPTMIHRALLGSLERFIGVLIEHYGGAFPTWLAPVQVKVIPVSDKFNKFAEKNASLLRGAGLRVEIDATSETVGKKIRNAEIAKIPYMIVLGEKEEKSGKVPVRSYHKGDLGVFSIEKFIELIKKEIDELK